MRKIEAYLPYAFFAMLLFVLTGCEAVAGIFKAGVWVGVLLVIIVIIVIIKLVSGSKK